ncbi:MAG TPA: carbamoyltransferase HypF [Candidatus Edwardsbacteria bacterium]|nr:carbamoyltransferase HypF [Candidatus Edwardsbacteria bacterium]
MRAVNIHINGIVQGVGFRPFVYRLAMRHGVQGWVANASDGVEIAAEGSFAAIDGFIQSIREEVPPQAVIDSLAVGEAAHQGFSGFVINESMAAGGVTRISPDIALCPDCLRELTDPRDRRRGYAFTNCTNCGPRFSIIEGTPYDRPKTSMKRFAMCPECRREYDDPGDRRFHAQPNACPKCGPQVTLRDAQGTILGSADQAITQAAELLLQGAIVAVKGIGGFHLACDAHDGGAVALLRQRKHRPDKPLAVMCASVDDARALCEVGAAEAGLLRSPQAPIVLLRKKGEALATAVAPDNRSLGVMLAYAPLHHLLFNELKKLRPGFQALVMTSGNVQDQPVLADNDQAFAELQGIADHFLVHDRGIVNRNDDSIVMIVGRAGPQRQGNGEAVQIVRHSRGYAPNPVALPYAVRPTLAVGGQMKNCFALASGDRAYVSQYIGEADNDRTMAFFEEMAGKYGRWFDIKPQVVVHDLHPDYLTTRWAKAQQGVELRALQHHRAHVLSVLADNGCAGPAIGVAFDGTGYGDDGAIWGGEFFICDNHGLERAGHLEYLPLPGGEASIKRPYRIAAAYSRELTGEMPAALFADDLRQELGVIATQVGQRVNTVMTSSVGRLFDAASALLGVCGRISFEAQAAIALEQRCDRSVTDRYPYTIEDGVVRVGELWRQLVADRERGVAVGTCAARFQNTLVDFAITMCDNLRLRTGIGTVALSGGVFQNRLLLETLMAGLSARGFTVLVNRQVPANDGGICLGQIMMGR